MAVHHAVQAVHRAKLVLVIGTSGEVWPAAGFIQDASQMGTLLVEVNPEVSFVSSDIAIRLPAGIAIPIILH